VAEDARFFTTDAVDMDCSKEIGIIFIGLYELLIGIIM